ncbi:MAG: hypothetical protein ABSB40_06010 [Nitrososphaeria archaeon]
MLVFTFISVWNEFFLAFVLTVFKAYTLPVAVEGAMGSWGQVSAMVILFSLPPLLLTWILLRYLPSYYKIE